MQFRIDCDTKLMSSKIVSWLWSWLAHGSKITFAKDGLFHKGFLLHQPNNMFQFSVQHRLSSKCSFPSEWHMLCLEDWLHPSWIIPSTIAPPVPYASASMVHLDLATLPPIHCIPACMPWTLGCLGSACHISAKTLQNPCPSLLQKTLNPSNKDHAVWLASYQEEKQSLQDINTYDIITLDQYCELCRNGAPQAIPSMCVMVVKLDKLGLPDSTKSCIMVLGNLEARF